MAVIFCSQIFFFLIFVGESLPLLPVESGVHVGGPLTLQRRLLRHTRRRVALYTHYLGAHITMLTPRYGESCLGCANIINANVSHEHMRQDVVFLQNGVHCLPLVVGCMADSSLWPKILHPYVCVCVCVRLRAS